MNEKKLVTLPPSVRQKEKEFNMEMNEKKLQLIVQEIINQVLNEISCNPRIKNMRGLKFSISARLRWLWLNAPRKSHIREAERKKA